MQLARPHVVILAASSLLGACEPSCQELSECLESPGGPCAPTLYLTSGLIDAGVFVSCTDRSTIGDSACSPSSSLGATVETSEDGERRRIYLSDEGDPYGWWGDVYWIDAPLQTEGDALATVCDQHYSDSPEGECLRYWECAIDGTVRLEEDGGGYVYAKFADGSSFEARWRP